MADAARYTAVTTHLRLAAMLGATAEGMTIDEIAGELDVSRRTAQRMRAALEELFAMDVEQDERQWRYRIRAGLSPALLTPTAEELAQLRLAADALSASGKPERAETLYAFERKILASMRSATRARVAPDFEALAEAQLPVAIAGPQSRIDGDVLRTCQQGLQAGCVLAFDYTAATGEVQHREVAPRGLLFGPRSYLVGALHDWGRPSLWRLDRMSGLALTDRAAWPDPDFDLRRYAARSFGLFQEKPQPVILRFDAEVSAEADSFIFHPDEERSWLEDGCLEVRFDAGGLLELAQHLFTWRGRVAIISPPDLVRIMETELRASLERIG